MVSAGELGTDSRYLESELQKILDICHTWGAILLLDEADVFLEKRSMHDIHRNALVGVFLRQLEYFMVSVTWPANWRITFQVITSLIIAVNELLTSYVYRVSCSSPPTELRYVVLFIPTPFPITVHTTEKLTKTHTDLRRRLPVAHPHRAAVRRARHQGEEGGVQDLHRAGAAAREGGPDALHGRGLQRAGAPEPQRPPDQERRPHRPGPRRQQGPAPEHAPHPRGPRRPAELRPRPQGRPRLPGRHAELLLKT